MKYYILSGCAIVVAVAALVLARMHSRPMTAADAHAEWKRYAVEPETKVRPARFEDMKFHPGAEIRAPASSKHK
jgi:hypothetical protein